MLEQYGAIAILAGVAFIFPFIPLIASAMIHIADRPAKNCLPTSAALTPSAVPGSSSRVVIFCMRWRLSCLMWRPLFFIPGRSCFAA